MDEIPSVEPIIDAPQPVAVTPPPQRSIVLPVLLAVFITSLVLVGGYITYQVIQLKSKINQEAHILRPAIVTTIKPISKTQDVPDNWKAYSNSKYDFSFKYPDDWNLRSFAGSQSIPEEADSVLMEGPYENLKTLEGAPKYSVQVNVSKTPPEDKTYAKSNGAYWIEFIENSSNSEFLTHIFPTLTFVSSPSVSPSSKPVVQTYSPGKGWQTVTNTSLGIETCLPPKWEFEGGIMYYNRDPQFRPSVGEIKSFAYKGGSRRQEYIDLLTQYEGYTDDQKAKTTVSDIEINNRSFLKIYIPGFTEALVTVVGDNLYAVSGSYYSLSKYEYSKEIFTIAGCFKPL